MNKWALWLFSALLLSACGERDVAYYQQHPKELGQALTECREQNKQDALCKGLDALAARLQPLALQLQRSPQAFGLSILELQERIAQKQALLKSNPSDQKLHEDLTQSQQHLTDLLTVARWFESPEG